MYLVNYKHVYILSIQFFVFLFHMVIINRLFIEIVIILGGTKIGCEGIKAIAEALLLNKNLAELNLCKFYILLTYIITIIQSK